MSAEKLNQIITTSTYGEVVQIWDYLTNDHYITSMTAIPTVGDTVIDCSAYYSTTIREKTVKIDIAVKFRQYPFNYKPRIILDNFFLDIIDRKIRGAVLQNYLVYEKEVHVKWNPVQNQTELSLETFFVGVPTILFITLIVPLEDYIDPIITPIQPVNPIPIPIVHPCRD